MLWITYICGSKKFEQPRLELAFELPRSLDVTYFLYRRFAILADTVIIGFISLSSHDTVIQKMIFIVRALLQTCKFNVCVQLCGVYLAMPLLTHLFLALGLTVYRDIKERIYSLRNKSNHKNRDAPKRPHILPVSRDVEIPPYEKAISRGVT